MAALERPEDDNRTAVQATPVLLPPGKKGGGEGGVLGLSPLLWGKSPRVQIHVSTVDASHALEPP